jgi:hypothetical protein
MASLRWPLRGVNSQIGSGRNGARRCLVVGLLLFVVLCIAFILLGNPFPWRDDTFEGNTVFTAPVPQRRQVSTPSIAVQELASKVSVVSAVKASPTHPPTTKGDDECAVIPRCQTGNHTNIARRSSLPAYSHMAATASSTASSTEGAAAEGSPPLLSAIDTDTTNDGDKNIHISPQCSRGVTYHQWFQRILVKHFGRVIADAVYDPEIYNAMLRSQQEKQSESAEGERSPWFSQNDHDFNFDGFGPNPNLPNQFNTIANVVWWTKRWITTAMTKISRDSELENLFERLCVDPRHSVKMPLFERTVAKALSAQVQYFFTVLQLGIDVCLSTKHKNAFQSLIAEHAITQDPLVLISGWIRSSTTAGDVAELFGSSAALTKVVKERYASTHLNQSEHDGESVSHGQPLFGLVYNDLAFSASPQPLLKFWNMLRPTASCSSIVRSCESPEGCRFVCNGEYMLHAGGGAGNGAESLPRPSPYHHRIIGMGSNNEFDWELSLLTLFKRAAAQSNGTSHRLGWMTAMDCTVTIEPGKRQWRVPQELREAPVGFAGASYCVSKGTAGTNKRGQSVMSIGCVKGFQLSSEASWKDQCIGPVPFVRFAAHPDALALIQQRGVDSEFAAFTMSPRPSLKSPSAPVAGPRWFDAVTILKIDVEGYEWNILPWWLREEFVSISIYAPPPVAAQGSTVSINFAESVPQYYTVSMFSLEFHRISSDRVPTAHEALGTHWLMLQTYALGFLMVSQERNAFSHDCCFEQTYAHVRHFIRSEMWMILREEL